MIAVFYSFKGGVGRSMAVANVGDLLARSGLKVLMLDFDMEAPGLEQYFTIPQSEARDHLGLLDLLVRYRRSVSLAATEGGRSFKELEDFILPVYKELAAPAKLDLMPAGQREGEKLALYAHTLRTFDWQDFLTNWGGDRFFKWLRLRVEELYDVVLIDSRTGVTEMGGICAYQLADTILMFSGANVQNIMGTQNLVRNFALPSVQLLREYRPLDVVVVPARIEHSDEELLERVRGRFAAAFDVDGALPRRLSSAGLSCWDLRIPYEPHYAFEEQVVTDPGRPLSERPIADSFRRIVRCLALLADEGSNLARLCDPDAGGPGPAAAPLRYDPTQRVAAFDAVFLYERRDRRAVDGLVQRLEKESNLRVWADWSSVPGTHWAAQLEEVLLNARSIVVVIGNGGVQGPLLEEINFVFSAIATRGEMRIVPVILPDTEDAALRMPRRLEELQWVDFRRGGHDEIYSQLVHVLSDGRAAASASRAAVDFGEPYVGVQAFTEQQALFFAGRNAALEELRQRVHASPFTALTGPVGSGKSSLVRAGLFPSLRQEQEVAWEILEMRPGEDAIASAAALLESINEKAAAAAILVVERSVPETVHIILDALGQRAGGNPKTRWLLFLDNAEELVAPGRDSKRSALFAQLLIALAQDAGGRLCVLAACRDDALSAIESAHPFLADLVRNNRIELKPMTVEDLRAAIEQPARQAGYAFEPGLLDRLLSDFAPDTRSLALLQSLLLELHRQARAGRLTNIAYSHLGGLAGFLAQRAEGLLDSLSGEERKAVMWLMLRLTQTSTDGKITRRRAKLSDLNSADILPALITGGLARMRDLGLIVTTTEGGEAAFELASETLLQAWTRLTDWIEAHGENLLMRNEIETTSQTTGAASLPVAMLERIAGEWASGTLRSVLNSREVAYVLRSARFHDRNELFQIGGETSTMPRRAARARVFVVMPFGQKDVPKTPRVDASTAPNELPLQVDFNGVYQLLFKPALKAAGLQPFRADDAETAGDILKDMFAELVTADFVLADISILNANVFYELGIRHTVGPRGVICVHAGWADRPFGVAPQRTFKYDGKLFQVGRERDAAWEALVATERERLGETLRKAVEADRTTEGSPVYGQLPNLVPPDASRIGTARFKHYRAQAEEWSQRVLIAGKEGRAEDILTLAGDVPSPYDRRKLLRQCGDALLALGRFAPSEKIFKELSEDLEGTGSIEEFRVRCQLALLGNRLGRTREAEQKLSDLARQSPGDPEAQGLLGRVYKDLWRAAWSEGQNREERLALAHRHVAVARKALAAYEVAVRHDLGSYYNGINVVTLAVLIEQAAQFPKRPAKREVEDLEDLATTVRFAAKAKLDDEFEGVWARATLGELHLALGDPEQALMEYGAAITDPNLTWFNVRSMFEQVQLFQFLGFRPSAVEPVVTLLQQRLAELPHPSARFDKIAICSGHMIDAPDRPTPRFPAAKADAVRAEIARQLAHWGIGPGDLAICGGACGADILFAEECLLRGAQVRLHLPQEIGDFIRNSVQHAGNDWVRRFHSLREKTQVATQPERLGKAPPDGSIYARNNLWTINTARIEAADNAKIHALLVWDGKPGGDGPGGTFDSAARVRELGGHITIINPTTLP